MPYERLKKGELVVMSRVPGFEDELHGIELRLASSGRASHTHSWFAYGAGRLSEQTKHVFNASVMRRISSLLQGLPPQGPPHVVIDDFPSWEFEVWSGEEVRTVRIHEIFLEERRRQHFERHFGAETYPAIQRIRALWALLNFPFKRAW
ncbi:hypothetical protein [Pyxidicoccus sp. MSG2]|uniref:hypothetical protein n=1 Tax=Pyxidicoccus sp. MSG2 TaxID=2996790 RepID=UPI00226DD0BF|nr:hypothetical protein [Pyxidicoccus sp. MSG2]MCY1017445.1 hypothetical protein [Pyxidicoccus sp. MSG2]